MVSCMYPNGIENKIYIQIPIPVTLLVSREMNSLLIPEWYQEKTIYNRPALVGTFIEP